MRAVYSRIHPSLGIYRKHSESFGALKGSGGKSPGFAVLWIYLFLASFLILWP
jgi:hypothetical protein